MSGARKAAFRRILYAAMLDFRAHWPVHPGTRRAWCTPRLWRETLGRMQQVQLTADWLHNLALHGAEDFVGFDEAWFWRDSETLVRRCPDLKENLRSYRFAFEQDFDPRANAYFVARRWGVVEPV